jgi:c-di-GMP-binding flagellar brake protein YcgR
MLLQTGAIMGMDLTPQITLYFLLGIALLVGLIIVGAVLSRRNRPRSAADIQQYSSGVFRRAGKQMGLGPQHLEVLEDLVRVSRVQRPLLVFTSTSLLDDTLKRGLYALDNARDLSDEERENRRSVIFQTKEILERNARKSATLKSTTFLRPGQLLAITPEGGSQFSSKVVSNMKDFLTVAAPAQPAEAGSRWMRGTGLSVYLWRENDAGYSFASKVLGYDTVKGVPSIIIQHSKTLRRAQRRINRRREIMRPCFYYPIRITETGQGRKVERKAVVEQALRTLGTVVDLSAGGCAIQSLNSFDAGKLVMIEFEIERKATVRAYGKVVRTSRTRGRGGVMHVKFTKVTRGYLNKISEFVYDFARPRTVGQAREQMDRARPNRGSLPPGARGTAPRGTTPR